MPETEAGEQTVRQDILDVDSIPDATMSVDPQGDTQPDRDTENIYANQLADDEHKERVEKLQSLKQDREQRKEFAVKIYRLICCWLCGIAVLLLLRAWNCGGFYLSDSVLIAIITSTSANVIGLLAIVVLYLFPRRKG